MLIVARALVVTSKGLPSSFVGSLRHEEISLQLVQLLELLHHVLFPFLLSGSLVLILAVVPRRVHERLELGVVDVPEHYEAFLRDVLDLLDGVVLAFAVLVHHVLAQAVVPGLKLVVYYLILLETPLYMAVAVEA